MKVRHVPIVVQAIYTGVSIHAPVKVRLNVRPEEIKTCIVSIHAPVKVRQNFHGKKWKRKSFNSRTCEGAT